MKPNSKHVERAQKIMHELHVEDFSPNENIAEIAQHLAAFEAEVTGWKPIDDAARSGKRFLFFVPPYGISTGHWDTLGVDHKWRMHSVLNKEAEPTQYREITLTAQPEKEGE